MIYTSDNFNRYRYELKVFQFKTSKVTKQNVNSLRSLRFEKLFKESDSLVRPPFISFSHPHNLETIWEADESRPSLWKNKNQIDSSTAESISASRITFDRNSPWLSCNPIKSYKNYVSGYISSDFKSLFLIQVKTLYSSNSLHYSRGMHHTSSYAHAHTTAFPFEEVIQASSSHKGELVLILSPINHWLSRKDLRIMVKKEKTNKRIKEKKKKEKNYYIVEKFTISSTITLIIFNNHNISCNGIFQQ